MYSSFYSKGFQNIVKCFAILASILLTVVTSIHFYKIYILKENLLSFYNITELIENFLAIFFFILLIIFPYKLEFLAIISFMYSFSCFISDMNNPISVLMYFLGNIVLYIRGFFFTNKKLKFIISSIVYVLLLVSEIHFGLSVFYICLFNKLGYTLVLALICFLLLSYKNGTNSNNEARKRLNLAEYPLLVSNDIPLLQNVLQNKQYKEIAMIVHRSEGTIRNRLNKIYDVLGVMDRKGFIMTYFGYDIVFEEIKPSPEDSENLEV